MKSLLLALVSSLVLAASAESHTAALVVQNHTDEELGAAVQHMADTLAIKVRGSGLSVINPANSVTSEADAINLARQHGADALLTASILAIDRETVVEDKVYRLVVSVALNLQDVETKRSLAGADVEIVSDNLTARQLASNKGVVFHRVMKKAADESARKLVADLKSVDWAKKSVAIANVNFTCNVRGADIKVDGVAMGTAPALISVPSGLHTLVVAYPYYLPYEVKANFVDGQTYNIVLHLNEAGRRQYKDDAVFAETMDRVRKTGATDDQVRLMMAEGEAQFWKNSGVKIEHGSVGCLSLNPPGNGDSLQKAPTVGELLDKAKK